VGHVLRALRPWPVPHLRSDRPLLASAPPPPRPSTSRLGHAWPAHLAPHCTPPPLDSAGRGIFQPAVELQHVQGYIHVGHVRGVRPICLRRRRCPPTSPALHTSPPTHTVWLCEHPLSTRQFTPLSNANKQLIRCAWAGTSAFASTGGYDSNWGPGSCLALEVTSDLTLDTDASPNGFSYYSLVIDAGATLNVIGSNPLIINVDHEVKILGTIDLSGGKGGNSAGDHKAAGGGAGGGALKISALDITIGPTGVIRVDGGDGGDGGGPGQGFFGEETPWSTGAGNGAGGVGVAGGGAGGAGGSSSRPGNAGSGPGASGGSPYHGGVPP
jgi:hypothetical protein